MCRWHFLWLIKRTSSHCHLRSSKDRRPWYLRAARTTPCRQGVIPTKPAQGQTANGGRGWEMARRGGAGRALAAVGGCKLGCEGQGLGRPPSYPRTVWSKRPFVKPTMSVRRSKGRSGMQENAAVLPELPCSARLVREGTLTPVSSGSITSAAASRLSTSARPPRGC